MSAYCNGRMKHKANIKALLMRRRAFIGFGGRIDIIMLMIIDTVTVSFSQLMQAVSGNPT